MMDAAFLAAVLAVVQDLDALAAGACGRDPRVTPVLHAVPLVVAGELRGFVSDAGHGYCYTEATAAEQEWWTHRPGQGPPVRPVVLPPLPPIPIRRLTPAPPAPAAAPVPATHPSRPGGARPTAPSGRTLRMVDPPDRPLPPDALEPDALEPDAPKPTPGP